MYLATASSATVVAEKGKLRPDASEAPRVGGGGPDSRGRWSPTRRARRAGTSRDRPRRAWGHPGIRHDGLNPDSAGTAAEGSSYAQAGQADGMLDRHRFPLQTIHYLLPTEPYGLLYSLSPRELGGDPDQRVDGARELKR